MKGEVFIVLFFVFFCGFSGFAGTVPPVTIENLHCEHMAGPLGIDAPNPRLSWQINDLRQGAKQKAYQILVGTDSLEVLKGVGKAWNTGKIKSDRMLVAYGGTALQSFTRYYWCVEIWDKDK
ncbi:MAG: alpha-rhamnosidase, partial [Bacteroidota bacterium]|nr:alpha-rhamnosidase [Bacteroidota bacterium]